MIRSLLFVLLVGTALAQKTDAIIPTYGLLFSYEIGCDNVRLPPAAYLLRVTMRAKNCVAVGLRSVPQAWQSMCSEQNGEKQISLYPAHAKLDQRKAVSSLFDRIFLVYPEEDEGTPDISTVSLEFEYWELGRGDMLVKVDRFRADENVLRPNQVPRPTPASVTPPASASTQGSGATRDAAGASPSGVAGH